MKTILSASVVGTICVTLSLGLGTFSSFAQTANGGNVSSTPSNSTNVSGGNYPIVAPGANSSPGGSNPYGGATAPGTTSSGATTHVNTAAGASPGDGNSGYTSTPPSGVTPGTGASPNPAPGH